jgi:hypothetical protein
MLLMENPTVLASSDPQRFHWVGGRGFPLQGKCCERGKWNGSGRLVTFCVRSWAQRAVRLLEDGTSRDALRRTILK